MAIKLKHSDVYSTYLITFTCYKWLHLFEITNCYDMVYKWFTYLKETRKAAIVIYVVMPNHIHVILYFEDANFSLNSIIGNAKRFMAYEIIKRLKEAGRNEILQCLTEGVSEREKKKGQLHKVFEESFDAKAIFSEKFLHQKISYIHLNPVSGKWNLVQEFTDYEHSSAAFYEHGEAKYFTPLHFSKLM